MKREVLSSETEVLAKHEHFLSTFTQCWVHPSSPLLFAVRHVEFSLAKEVYHSKHLMLPRGV